MQILKSTERWKKARDLILNDVFPRDTGPGQTYVKFSNAGKDNKRVIEAYFEMGINKPKDRQKLMRLILGELERKNQSGRFD
jgi:hypothetical protein